MRRQGLIAALVWALAAPAWGASTGWVAPASCDETSAQGGTIEWSGETNATTSNDVRAAALTHASDVTTSLRCLFAFDLPFGADVVTVDARVETQATIAGITTRLLVLQTGDGDTPYQTLNAGLAFPALSDGYVTVLDGASNWLGGGTAAFQSCAAATAICDGVNQYNINHANLGVLVSPAAGVAGIVHVDQVQMRVNYKPPRADVYVFPPRPITVPTIGVLGVDPPPTIAAGWR